MLKKIWACVFVRRACAVVGHLEHRTQDLVDAFSMQVVCSEIETTNGQKSTTDTWNGRCRQPMRRRNFNLTASCQDVLKQKSHLYIVFHRWARKKVQVKDKQRGENGCHPLSPHGIDVLVQRRDTRML
jgi:hypothetical protein